MADYTIVLQLGDDPETRTIVLTADSFAEARGRAFQLFSDATAGHGYVAIGRGRDDQVDWIGAFDFAPGAGPRWEAAE